MCKYFCRAADEVLEGLFNAVEEVVKKNPDQHSQELLSSNADCQ